MSTLTPIPLSHIRLDEHGVALIDGTAVKVIEVVLEQLANGSSLEEIRYQHPHLSLAQVHAALAYYYDHQEELDADMERRIGRVEALAARAEETPFRKRLYSQKGFIVLI